MPTVFLLRHGRSTANTAGVLAGWTEGVELDGHGQGQAEAVAARLESVAFTALVSSPLQRCQQTIEPIAASRADLGVQLDDRIGEARYGDWTGQPLKALVKHPLWKVVQSHPSAVTFPGDGGESMVAMSQRAVDAVRDWNSRLGPDSTWLLCSHGDVIKAILADALGLHLDQFQRIAVDPCSISVVRYTDLRPFVVRMNDAALDLASLVPPIRKRRSRRSAAADSDAAVGGGAGAVDAAPKRRTRAAPDARNA